MYLVLLFAQLSHGSQTLETSSEQMLDILQIFKDVCTYDLY